MAPKRKCTKKVQSNKKDNVKKTRKATSEENLTSTTTITASTQFTILENGHIDFVYDENNDDDDGTKKKGVKQRQKNIYLVLTPAGTTDKFSKRRIRFIKTRIEEEGPYFVQLENMANNGTSSEASMINRDTVRIMGQVAVGSYSIIFDAHTKKTHLVYVLLNNNEGKRAIPSDTEKKLIDHRNGQNSFTIEIHNQEECEKKLLEKFRENSWMSIRPERLMCDEEPVQMVFTENNEDLVKEHAHFLSINSVSHQSKKYEELWKKVNDHFKSTPKYQNHSILGVSEYDFQQTERRLGNIKLPDDIKNAVRIHNGRSKFGFGLHYRSPTTDLLPLNEWYPYESQECCDFTFEQVSENDEIGDLMKEDLREHLKVYEKNKKSVKTKEFKELQTELLVIGEGMDDYCEQYLLGLRTGTIYLQILNIPEWNKIGQFKDWVEMALDIHHSSEDEEDE